MKLVKCDYNEVEKAKRTNLTELILQFRDSGIKCVKVEDWNYCSPRCCAGTINRRAKSLKLFHIKAVTRSNNVYIVNTIIK